MNLKNINKSSILLILTGLHSLSHVIQFIQSVLLISHGILENSHHAHDVWFNNPYFNIFWGIVGVASLIIGLKNIKSKHSH